MGVGGEAQACARKKSLPILLVFHLQIRLSRV